MVSDPIGAVADARAAMMLRGQAPLILTVGSRFWAELCRADPALAGLAAIPGAVVAQVLDMPCMVRADMEGFVVQKGQDRPERYPDGLDTFKDGETDENTD